MSVARDNKKEQIDAIKSKINKAKSMVLVEYKGIKVQQDIQLRANCRKSGIDYSVLKNRLVKIALNELGYNQFDTYLENCTAVAFSYEDALGASKIMTDAAKAVKNIQIKCGLCEGNFVDANMVSSLASIPSKEVLLCQLCGVLQSGISGLARAISQIAEQKESI